MGGLHVAQRHDNPRTKEMLARTRAGAATLRAISLSLSASHAKSRAPEKLCTPGLLHARRQAHVSSAGGERGQAKSSRSRELRVRT